MEFNLLERFYKSDLCKNLSIIKLNDATLNFNPKAIMDDERFSKIFSPLFLNSKMTSSLGSRNYIHEESIFKHTSGFYLYIKKELHPSSPEYSSIIFYDILQYDEVKLFINKFIKLWKN
jgi:hypothetical protein